MEKDLTKELQPSGPIDLLIAGWLNELASVTKTVYENRMANFREYLHKQGFDLNSNTKDLQLMTQIWANQKEDGERPSAATQNAKLNTLASFCKYADIRLDAGFKDFTRGIKRWSIQQYADSKALPDDIIQSGLAKINRNEKTGVKYYALFLILFFSGKRIQEVINLKLEDIDLVRGGFEFRHCKNDKTFRETLRPEVIKAISKYMEDRLDSVWLFPAVRNKNKHISYTTVHDFYQRYFATGKIHTSRHTYATTMRRAGATIEQVQEALGHASEKTTRRYIGNLERGSEINPFLDGLIDLLPE